MGKTSAYRELKFRERASQLAEEKGISFDEAMIEVKAKRRASNKILKKMNKRRVSDGSKSNQIDAFRSRVTPGLSPVQGGAPGLGKKG